MTRNVLRCPTDESTIGAPAGEAHIRRELTLSLPPVMTGPVRRAAGCRRARHVAAEWRAPGIPEGRKALGIDLKGSSLQLHRRR
jgi:hypothetical protein